LISELTSNSEEIYFWSQQAARAAKRNQSMALAEEITFLILEPSCFEEKCK
jgi:hypothetical protein